MANENQSTGTEEKIESAGALANFFENNKSSIGRVATEESTEEVEEVEEEVKEEIEVDDDGLGEKEVKKETKEVTTTTTEDDDDSVIGVVAEAFKDEFELEGEFEDNAEGLVEATKFIVNKAKEAGQKEGLENFFAKKPLLKEIDEHLEAGGSLLSLLQTQQLEDFSKIEIGDEDLDVAESLYRQALAYKGNDEDAIDTLVNAAKDKGIIVEKGKLGKDVLVTAQKAIVDKQVADEKKQKEDEILEVKKVEEKVKTVLASKKINGVDITPEEATRLEKFIFEKDSKGETEREKKWANLTMEQNMLLDRIVMDDFKSVGGKAITVKKEPLKFKVKKAAPTVNLNTGGTSIGTKLGIKDARDLFGTPKE